MPTSSYGVPGSATYSQDLGDLDHIMSALPDNTINQITAKNVRDSTFTMYNIIQSAIAANLSQVTAVGNTTSRSITIGGLQVSGTSSLYNNLGLLATLSDKNGATGTNGYVITATNGGVVWAPQSVGGISATPSLQQVLEAGNTASSIVIFYGNASFRGGVTSFLGGDVISTARTTFTGAIEISDTLEDRAGKTGPAGYILSATAGGVQWIPNTGAGGGNLFQSTSLGNTTSNSIIISNNVNPILLSATMGTIMSFTGPISATGIYGSLRYDGLTYKYATSTYVINVPVSVLSNAVISFPAVNSGTLSTTSQLYLDNVLATGNTSSRHANIGSLTITSTASFGSTVSISAGVNVSGYSNLNNLYVSGTATFVGTASFSKGILDNYNSSGTTYSLLAIDSTGKIKWQQALALQFNTITTNYTLSLNDAGRMISVTSSSVTLITVPTNASVAFPIGSWVTITQYDTGGVTFVGAGGVTVNSKSGYLSIAAQYVTVTLTKMGTNAWILTGDLIP